MDGYQKRAQEKRRQILGAAFQLMNTEEGVAGLTMKNVAEKSGTAKATIFKYFGSKENLIHSVFIDFLEKMSTKAEVLLKENHTFEETVIGLGHIKLESLAHVKQQFFVDLMSCYTQKENAELAKIMMAYTKRNLEMMLDLFHQGRKEEKIDLKYSDEFLMLYFEALMYGVSQPEIYQKIDYHYTEEWTEVLLKGIAPAK